MKIEKIKYAIVDNEIDYIKQMVIEDKWDDLVEFVYAEMEVISDE